VWHEEVSEAKNTLYNDSSYTEYIIRMSHKDSFSVAVTTVLQPKKNKKILPKLISFIMW